MKIRKISLLLIIFSVAVLLFIILSPKTSGNTMYIESDNMKEGGMLKLEHVFNGFGCEGENKVPQISIGNIPVDAKSLALTVYDPDAPTGSGWWHYIAYNIPTYINKIAKGESKIAQGVKFGKNDFGTYDYGGPCPPKGHGKHRYIFTVYALSVENLELPKDASPALIGYNLNASAIEKSSLTAYYERK